MKKWHSLLFLNTKKVHVEYVDELDKTHRGDKGFGSSGRY